MELISRRDAIAQGLRRFFTGKRCKHGHVAERIVANYACAKCASLNSIRCAEKRPEHPAQLAARAVGETRYSTGEPCQNGHHAERFTANGICVECGAANIKRWLDARPGLEAKWARERRAANPLPHRAEARRWYENNRIKAKEIADRWKKKNPERLRQLRRVGTERRRSRVAGNGGTFTVADVERIYAAQRGRCAFCRTKPKKLEIDHILAIARGGGSDPKNLQLLCKTCNRSKQHKDQMAWAREKGMLL